MCDGDLLASDDTGCYDDEGHDGQGEDEVPVVELPPWYLRTLEDYPDHRRPGPLPSDPQWPRSAMTL